MVSKHRSKKARRHSGWCVAESTIRMPHKYIIDNCLEPQLFWDDWQDYRDGFRDFLKDRTKIKKVSFINCWLNHDDNGYYSDWVKKFTKDRYRIKRHLKIRRARKIKTFIYRFNNYY